MPATTCFSRNSTQLFDGTGINYVMTFCEKKTEKLLHSLCSRPGVGIRVEFKDDEVVEEATRLEETVEESVTREGEEVWIGVEVVELEGESFSGFFEEEEVDGLIVTEADVEAGDNSFIDVGADVEVVVVTLFVVVVLGAVLVDVKVTVAGVDDEVIDFTVEVTTVG